MTANATRSSSPSPLSGVIGTRLDGAPLALLLDIDGTLAPIAPRPEDARIPDATRAVLRRLRDLPGAIVALVTGRSAADALRMADRGFWILGNHGLETLSPDGSITPNPAAVPFEQSVAAALRALAALPGEVSGVLLENKRWGLSVHYRLAPAEAVSGVEGRVRAAAAATGLRLTEGKKIFELRPPVAVHKGTAVLEFLARENALLESASVFYAGDDRTDEDAFQALRRATPRAVTVRVRSSEEPAAGTSAEIMVESPGDVAAILAWIAERRAPATS